MENLITEVDILDEAKECFLTYSAEVLTDRAIPAAEDGLLSSQRKILWTMEDYLKMNNKSKTKKCNGIVGSTLSTSYYHGDSSCYGVLCKMSQKYLMRYPLIEGQGSLGTQEDNDLVASSRYTEAKPSIYTDLMMLDYKKNPVPTKETYNGEFMEPVVLPSLFPNALCNGRQAIGISMAHNSLPHNLTEVCNAILAYLKNSNLTIDDIMQYIKGPDFPLKNTVINSKDIKAAFFNGRSSVSLKVRGNYEIKGNKIIFNTIPYRAYRNKIKEQLEKNINEFEDVLEDFNDESNLGINKLVFYAKDGSVNILLEKLFKYTDLQSSVSYNMNYIVNGTPKLCSIKDLIESYVEHQYKVMINIATVDLDKAKIRKNIVEGLLIAIEDIDTAIQLIKTSENKNEACKRLMQHFNISEIQANAVLDMKLSKLTRLDKDELLKELKELKLAIEKYLNIINNEEYRNKELSHKIIELRDKYGDERRTELLQLEIPKTSKPNFIPKDIILGIDNHYNIKIIDSLTSFKTKRNKENYQYIIKTSTDKNLIVFMADGKTYKVDLKDIEKNLNAIAILSQSGKIIDILEETNKKYLMFVTKNGMLKKTSIEEYKNIRRNSTSAIKLKDGDEVRKIHYIDDEPIIIITENGQTIYFNTSTIKPVGRAAMGVIGIKLKDGDKVASFSVVENKEYMLTVSTNGNAKKTLLSEYTIQNRGGVGIIGYKCPNGDKVADILNVNEKDTIIIYNEAKLIKISCSDVPTFGRNSQGNHIGKYGKITNINII